MDMLQATISRAMEGKKVMAMDLARLLGWLNSMQRSHGSLPGVLTRTCQHLLGVAVNTYGYGFLVRGSRQPEIQKIMTDIKCRERRLDIRIVPVWTPRTQARIVMANLGSKMSSSTDEYREDLARMFTEMNYRPDFDCMASHRNAICEKYFLIDSAPVV